MNQFRAQIQSYISLSEKEVNLIKECIHVESFKAKTNLSQQGRICNAAFYIVEGVVRTYHIDNDGSDITRSFFRENNFLCDMDSFNFGVPATNSFQTVIDSKIIVITKEVSDYLSSEISEMKYMINRIANDVLIAKFNISTFLLQSDALTKYQYFIETYPDIVKRVPLGQIASYLGIAQQSLSRIRKQISL